MIADAKCDSGSASSAVITVNIRSQSGTEPEVMQWNCDFDVIIRDILK
jgi:hypothetical protein